MRASVLCGFDYLRCIGILNLLICVFVGACSGSGDLGILTSQTVHPPIDSSTDTTRSVTEYLYSPLTDSTVDIVRTTDNFNFKTVVETDLELQINLFDQGGKSIARPANALIVIEDAQQRLIWAGLANPNGSITTRLIVSAKDFDAKLSLYREGFSTREIVIEKIARKSNVKRTLYMKESQASRTSASIQPRLSLSASINASVTGDISFLDSDGDGVVDAFDAYPLDPSRAFRVYVPAERFMSVAFEDLFPVVGDGDYNDFLARYTIAHVLNAQNQIVEIQGTADAVARLAGYDHRFGLVINFTGNATLDVQYAENNCTINSSTSSALANTANIILFERSSQSFPSGQGRHTFFTLHFNQPIAQTAIDQPPYDPYVYVHNTTRDVHLIGKPQLPGSTNPPTPVGFRDSNGFPWALLVPSDWSHPKEGKYIEAAYPQFIPWRQSLGQTNTDWYNFPIAANVTQPPAVVNCTANFEVQQTLPQANSTNNPTNSEIRMFLNQSIDPNNVNYQTVKVLHNNTPITAAISVNANEIRIVPDYALFAGNNYTVNISPLLKSVTGENLINGYSFIFTTELNASVTLVKEVDLLDDGKVLYASGNDIFFGALTPSLGFELWQSDGTLIGTTLVRDIYMGEMGSEPRAISTFGGNVYFTADHPAFGREIFRSNGTLSGTNIFQDFTPGTSAQPFGAFVSAGSKLFFSSSTPTVGEEIFVSDGSTVQLLRDINANEIVPGQTANATPTDLTNVQGILFFVADDGLHGRELFVSSGTSVSTALVKDILLGAGSSAPSNITAMQNLALFSAHTPTNGRELWRSDGTFAGTFLAGDIYTGTASSFPQNLTAVGATLFFTGSDEDHGRELWVYSEPQGAAFVRDLKLGPQSSTFGETLAYNGQLLFVRTNLIDGDELWRSDGTEIGTVLVRKLNPGAIRYLTPFQGLVYFSADDGLNGQELWRTDGTFSGTVMVNNIKPGAQSSNPSHLTASDNALYFSISDQYSSFSQALWIFKP